MERADALEQVTAELTHIPWWPGEYQGMLRAIYRMFRANDLGEKGMRSAGEVLHRCVAIIWRDVPGARINYDQEFFDG